MKRVKVKVLIYVSGAIALALILLFVYKFLIQADTNAVTIRGTIFLGLSNSASNTPASGVTVTALDYKGTQWATVTNQYGQYTFVIDKPVGCNYKIFVSGPGYNAREVGNVSLASVIKDPRQTFNYFANKETDLMWSKYFNASYPFGYSDNFYHFSKWDLYYIKNLTTLDQIINPKAPAAASFEVPFEQYKTMQINQKFPQTLPQGADNVWVIFKVSPVKSDWVLSKTIAVDKPVYTLKKKLSDLNSEGKVKFDFSLTGLDQNTRYQSYINGFQVVTDFYPADVNGNPISDPNAGYMNPDIRIYRSEDGKIVTVNYTGLETMPKDIFVEPVVSPTVGTKLTSDFGWRISGKKWHDGIDFSGAGIRGTNIKAVNPGKIEYVDDNTCGTGIRIKHQNNVTTIYCHMIPNSRSVANGAEVCTGQVIGKVGNSGRSDGPHLHFGLMVNGSKVDPFPYFYQFFTSVDPDNAGYQFKGWPPNRCKNFDKASYPQCLKTINKSPTKPGS